MQQMDDYRPGKPGSAEVKQFLDYHGLFLYDTDRPYDHQALDALKQSYRLKKAQYDAAIRSMTDHRAAANMPLNDESMEETIKQMGYATLRDKIEVLGEAIGKFQEVVDANPLTGQRRQLDPARTVYVMDPPREFPSVAAMEFFLKLPENVEIRAKHQAFALQRAGAPAVEDVDSSAAEEAFDDEEFSD